MTRPAMTHLLICLILFALLDLSFSTNTMHKLYDKSIGLKCPGCDSDQCPISINGVNTTIAAAPGYSIQNGQLIVPSHDWDVYGTYRCEGLDKQLFYTICPTETCEGCLIISVNATTTAVGDIVMVNCSMNRGSHTGITLFINSVASTNPSADMRCSTESIQGHLVTYYCIAKKRGVMNITANTEFCDIVVDSQQIGITIEEQRMHNITEDHHELSTVAPPAMNVSANASRIIPVATTAIKEPITPPTMTSTTTSTAHGSISTTMPGNSTPANGPKNREEADQHMPTGLIVVIVVILFLILFVTTVILGVILFKIKICKAKKHHGQIEHPPPVMVEDGNECNTLDLPSQQPEQCTQHYMVQE